MEIDLRQIFPSQRKTRMFDLIEILMPGASIIFLDNLDPKALYYLIENQHPPELLWTYVEKGPSRWRVEVRKLI